MKNIEGQLLGIKQRVDLKQWIDDLPDGAELMAVARYETPEGALHWQLRGFCHCADTAISMFATALQYAVREEFGCE